MFKILQILGIEIHDIHKDLIFSQNSIPGTSLKQYYYRLLQTDNEWLITRFRFVIRQTIDETQV